MASSSIVDQLAQKGAVFTDSHFIYTSGKHGPAYINLRSVADDAKFMLRIGRALARALNDHQVDVVIGPETLGRNLAILTAPWTPHGIGIWCRMEKGADDIKFASFDPKLGFGDRVVGKRVAIVDDLLTTGSSIKLVSDLIRASGGIPVVAGVVVRRSPDVTAEDCGVPALEVLAEANFIDYTPEECSTRGPCSTRVPVVLRPGHGHEWIKSHEDYPIES